MAFLSFPVIIACVLFWIIGIHTETSRVLMATVAPLVILQAVSLAVPAVTNSLVSGTPTRDANGELLYTMKFVHAYRGAGAEASTILYLPASIFIAGSRLFIYRFLASGIDRFRHLRAKPDNESP